MFISSFFGLNSQKSEKPKDRHSRHSEHREKPHRSSRHHHSRRREQSDPPEYASEGGSRDREDEYHRRNPYPRDRRDHGRVDPHSRHERGPDRRTHKRDRREYARGMMEDKRDRRDTHGDNDDQRDRRQSERRTGGGCKRSPSLRRALHRQPGETAQDMRDRVDGHSRRSTKYDGEQVPKRSPSPEQEEESPDRRSFHRRPGYTTTTSYQYRDEAMEDPAPGQLPKSATWPSEDPSRGGPHDDTSRKERVQDQAPSSPMMNESPVIEPVRRRHTDFTTSYAYKSGLDGKSWSETQQSLFSNSRTVRLPAPGPVRMLDPKYWNSKDFDQGLAREIAFTDLGLTVERELLFRAAPV